MNELILELSEITPRDFFGQRNVNIELIKKYFPKLKIVARGNYIKAYGDEDLLSEFDRRMAMLLEHFGKYNKLDENAIERVLTSDDKKEYETSASSGDVLVHGVSGKLIKAQTANQRKIVDFSRKNDMIFAVGPAGTGKTYTGVALAVKALKEKEVKRIILTRPAVEAGENLGFLPGDLKEKLDPYMQPLYDALRDMIPHEKLESYIEKGVIQIAPMAFMRGRTLDNAFVILDEAQNTTHAQMKMFLTRMGKSAKFLITGDPGQVDLPRRSISGLKEALLILKDVQGVAMVYLDDKDVIRHKLVKEVIAAYKKIENRGGEWFKLKIMNSEFQIMNTAREDIISKIKGYFKNQPVVRAYLFGSFGRGQECADSDIDVLVELDYSKQVGLEFIQMKLDLERLLNKKVDLVSANGLSKYIKPIIDKEKKLIYAR